MYSEEIKVSCGEGRYKINISSILTDNGISVTITGGEKPHVGGIALSVPRPVSDSGKISCDTWIAPVPGHKDIEIAAPVAELVCRQTGITAAVAAGIHIQAAEKREIEILIENSREAAKMLIEQIKQVMDDKIHL